MNWDATRRAWRTADSTLSAMFAFLLGFVLLIVSGVALAESHGSREFPLVLVIAMAVLVPEVMFLGWLRHALEAGEHPVAPRLAISQWHWPVVLRPLVAAWWLAHFLAAVGAALALHTPLPEPSPHHYPLWLSIWLGLVVEALTFTATYSANLYLLLACSAVWNNARLVAWVWRWRVAIDAAVVLGAWLLGPWLRDALWRR